MMMKIITVFKILIVATILIVDGTIICPSGSVLYIDQCWCDINFRSSTGLWPCLPCGSNSTSSTTGSTRCTCNINFFSQNGFDYSNNSCTQCPQYTYTAGVGTIGSDASRACICGTSNAKSWGYERFAEGSYNQLPAFINDLLYPSVITRSDTGYFPCYICENNTLPIYHSEYWSSKGGTPVINTGSASSCICKPGYKSSTGGIVPHNSNIHITLIIIQIIPRTSLSKMR